MTADGTVGKALSVLDLVAERGRPVRFAELLGEAGLPKATLYRLLQTLVSQGMLSYAREEQTYSLGLRLVRLAHQAWRQTSLAPVAREALDALASEVGETVHLAQLDNGQVLYVDKRNAVSPIDMFSQAGKVGPCYCTGVGKAMLAFLDEPQLTEVIGKQSFYRCTDTTITSADRLRTELADIRRDGIALDREEHEAGIICIAAPLLMRSGRLLGAISVTTSTRRSSLEDLRGYEAQLRNAAALIAETAESWQFPG